MGIGLSWVDDAGAFGAEIKDLRERHRQLVTELDLTQEGRKIAAHWIPREKIPRFRLDGTFATGC